MDALMVSYPGYVSYRLGKQILQLDLLLMLLIDFARYSQIGYGKKISFWISIEITRIS